VSHNLDNFFHPKSQLSQQIYEVKETLLTLNMKRVEIIPFFGRTISLGSIYESEPYKNHSGTPLPVKNKPNKVRDLIAAKKKIKKCSTSFARTGKFSISVTQGYG
jgi:uncharacterized protein (UPF0128 family)